MQTVGFVGLGHMGANMAARFLDGGYPVHGSARSRDRAQWLVDRGLRWAGTPREIAVAADVVFTSLPDDETVESVAGGPDGLLAGLTPDKLWVDVSTISPRASRGLAAQARARGAQMLDAPVSGSVPQVQAGTLTIMVGGDEEAYGRAEPLLRVLGTPTRIGDSGQGLMLKLAINISLAVQVLAFSEGLLLAARDGIDPELAAKVMTHSPIGSSMLAGRAPLILDLPDDAWFDTTLMHKDIRLALAAAHELDVPLPSAAVADRMLRCATDMGYGHRDIAALFRVLDRTGQRAVREHA
jgi:3-hydroxyisobutyrate dehydrogenase-like beta-hydroxyacid dehydrogenase